MMLLNDLNLYFKDFRWEVISIILYLIFILKTVFRRFARTIRSRREFECVFVNHQINFIIFN